MDSSLSGQVALVTGATRGAGRGIAVELGAFGLIDREQDGRLDVLVNDIWGGDPFLGDFHVPFWKKDLAVGLEVLHNAVDTHISASWHAAPRMLKRGRGLIVEITDGEPENYHDHLFYDLPKKTAMRLAVAYAEELGPPGITGVALSPGWLRSEAMLEGQGVTEDNWQDWYWHDPAHRPAPWLASQTPRYTGRAIVALATDPDVTRWNGQAVKTHQLAGEYGFTDLNGTQPGHGRHAWELLDSRPPAREDYAP